MVDEVVACHGVSAKSNDSMLIQASDSGKMRERLFLGDFYIASLGVRSWNQRSALIGLVGVLVGALLAEHFHRRNRVEVYSQKIFERRLETYEELMKLVQNAYTVASEVIEHSEIAYEDRLSAVSEAIHSIAQYTDENALFVDTYVAAQTTAMIMGVEDIQNISDESERKAAIAAFRAGYKAAKKMILEESGVHQINEHFKLVSCSNPKSPIIQRIKELQRDAG